MKGLVLKGKRIRHLHHHHQPPRHQRGEVNQSPSIQMPAPNNFNGEYRVPSNNRVRINAHAIVQPSSSVTLVIDVNWYALFAAST